MIKIIRGVFFTAAACIAVYSIGLILANGFLFNSSIFFSALAVCAALYGRKLERLSKIKWLNASLCAGAACFICLAVFIASYGKNDTATFSEDAAVILGGGIRNGTVQPVLRSRLDAAVEYHSKNPNAVLVVTGGTGRGEEFSEAFAMESYLLSKGVPQNKIFREDEALTTFENIRNSKNILEGLFDEAYTAVIITSDFHVYRASRFAKQTGLEYTSLRAKTPAFGKITNYLREPAAVIKL